MTALLDGLLDGMPVAMLGASYAHDSSNALGGAQAGGVFMPRPVPSRARFRTDRPGPYRQSQRMDRFRLNCHSLFGAAVAHASAPAREARTREAAFLEASAGEAAGLTQRQNDGNEGVAA